MTTLKTPNTSSVTIKSTARSRLDDGYSESLERDVIGSNPTVEISLEDVSNVDGVRFPPRPRQVGNEELFEELTEALTTAGVTLLQRVRDSLKDERQGVRRTHHHKQLLRNGTLNKRMLYNTILLYNCGGVVAH